MNRKRKNNNNNKSGARNLLIMGLLLVSGVIFVAQVLNKRTVQKIISYTQFLDKVERGEVKQVDISGQQLIGKLHDDTYFETTIAEDPSTWAALKKAGVDVWIKYGAGGIGIWYLLPFLSTLFMLGLLAWYIYRQTRGSSGGGGSQNIFGVGRSRARMFMPSEIKVNFDSVAGAEEAKEELRDIVEYLKNPEKYKKIGAKVTRGVLLIGEPGNGKTLLAKAVAGEANCPFFTVSGSDFIEVFVGVGASRVRDLFSQARKNAPAIVFIDEIDAIGRQRGTGLGGGHDEREQTLNQLLTEMDGFQTQAGSVIVLAATNRPDVLDKALLRPGRFDRRVEVPYPDLASRLEILKLHAKDVKMDDTIDLEKIARGTPGFTGADLANLINEAAIHATREGKKKVSIDDFEEARDKILLGKETKSMVLSEEEKKVTAYHEAGHALVRLMLPDVTEPLHKVTIIPRGRALGVTHWLPERDKYTSSKDEMEASIMSALGGRGAEEIIFSQLMTGAESDFRAASHIARDMVCRFGMHPALGPISYLQRSVDFTYSEETAAAIDKAVREIVDSCYQRTKAILSDNIDKLEKLAEKLLEKETLYAGEIYELLNMPPRKEHTFR